MATSIQMEGRKHARDGGASRASHRTVPDKQGGDQVSTDGQPSPRNQTVSMGPVLGEAEQDGALGGWGSGPTKYRVAQAVVRGLWSTTAAGSQG